MFGSLQLKNCGLSPEDRQIYRSHFCSVCHAMTEFGGKVSSLLTNYDVTFWLLLQSALDSRPPTKIESRPCTAVFFSRVDVRPISDEVAKTLAAVNLALVHAKVEDDRQDGERLKPFAADLLWKKNFKKAIAHLEEVSFPLENLQRLPSAQAEAESLESPSVDDLAAPTARCMADIFGFIATLHKNDEIRKPLRKFGGSLGSYLYLWDALLDLDEDRKKGNFNAIVAAFPEVGSERPVRQFLVHHLSKLREILGSTALGPEGKLCVKLLDTLSSKLNQRLPAPKKVSAVPNPRKRLDKAGLCVLDCCECGACCDLDCCDCNPCDASSGACCEVDCCGCGGCCDVGCCGGGESSGCCDLCCCGDSGSSSGGCCGDSGSSSGGCCSGSDAVLFCDVISCCDCCWCTTGDTNLSRRSTVRKTKHILSDYKFGLGRPKATIEEKTGGDGQCPTCELNMIQLQVGDVEIDECRQCGGIWLDDQEVDRLAKMPTLPHNLLNRYPRQEANMVNLPGSRPCPRCTREELVSVPYLNIPVEMCRGCRGFWVEHGILRKLLKAKRSPRKLIQGHRRKWRCPYCENVMSGGTDVCESCGAPRPKTGFTGKLS